MKGDFRLGEWLICPQLNTVQKDGGTVRLEHKFMQVLVCLAGQPGEVVSKDELIRTVWVDTFVTDDVLTRAVSKLRRILKDDAKQPHIIETVSKSGYRLIAPVQRIKDSSSAREREIGSLGSTAGIQSLAVLPLENLSGDAEQEYFAEGLTEALINTVAKIGALRVTSRTSAMRYRKTDKNVPQIARELNVDAIVEGTVLRSGERIRISVQLIDAHADTHLWAESYDSDVRDVLALHSGVSQAIAREIQVKLTPQEQVQIAQVSPVDPEAYEAYLKGRYHWSRGSGESLNRAIQYFNDVIRFDPSYAPGYAGLADAYSDLAVFNFRPPKEAFPKAKDAALKAIEVDSNLADAHGALASLAWAYDWDWLGAEKEYKKAVELKPISPSMCSRYAVYLVNMGRFDAAKSEARQAHKLDPLSPVATATVGWVYMLARCYDEALAWYNRALELESHAGVLTRADIAWTYALKGAHAEAISEYEKLTHRPTTAENQAVAGGLGFLLAVSGRRREALDIIAQLKTLSESSYIDGCMVAAIYAGLGDEDHAFEWLTKAYEERSSSMAFLRVNPFLDNLRSDPRFQDLMRRMNFPA